MTKATLQHWLLHSSLVLEHPRWLYRVTFLLTSKWHYWSVNWNISDFRDREVGYDSNNHNSISSAVCAAPSSTDTSPFAFVYWLLYLSVLRWHTPLGWSLHWLVLDKCYSYDLAGGKCQCIPHPGHPPTLAIRVAPHTLMAGVDEINYACITCWWWAAEGDRSSSSASLRATGVSSSARAACVCPSASRHCHTSASGGQ